MSRDHIIDDETYAIKSINFGILTPDEILKMGVVEITKNKNFQDSNSIYDTKMGASELFNEDCRSCGKNIKDCPGHFGYIRLNKNILHPLFYKLSIKFLKIFCHCCYKPLITYDLIQNMLTQDCIKDAKKTLEEVLSLVEDKSVKTSNCLNEGCNFPQPTIMWNRQEQAISKSYKHKIIDKKDNKVSLNMDVDEIKKIFDNIDVKYVKMLGFDEKMFHPKSLVISILPVLPPASRPYVLSDGNICDDDLTNQYLDIVKANTNLAKNDLSEAKRLKYEQALKFRIATLMNNSTQKAKHQRLGASGIKNIASLKF